VEFIEFKLVLIKLWWFKNIYKASDYQINKESYDEILKKYENSF
jgi:hypothetical protein